MIEYGGGAGSGAGGGGADLTRDLNQFRRPVRCGAMLVPASIV